MNKFLDRILSKKDKKGTKRKDKDKKPDSPRGHADHTKTGRSYTPATLTPPNPPPTAQHSHSQSDRSRYGTWSTKKQHGLEDFYEPQKLAPSGTGYGPTSRVANAAPAAPGAEGDLEGDDIAIGIRARVLYDYKAQQEDELALVAGEIVIVYEQDDSGWWTGEMNGNYGLFPGSFVQILEEDEVVEDEKNVTRQESIRFPKQISQKSVKKEEKKEVEDRTQQLEQELEVQRQRTQELAAELELTRKKLEYMELESALDEWRGDSKKTVEEDIAKLNERLELAMSDADRIRDLEEANAKIRESLEESTKNFNKSEDQKRELEERLLKTKEEGEKLRTELKQNTDREKGRESNAFENQIKEMQTQNEQLKTDLAQAQKQLDGVRSYAKLEEENKQMTEQNEVLNKKLKQLQTEKEKKEKELEREVLTLRQKLEMSNDRFELELLQLKKKYLDEEEKVKSRKEEEEKTRARREKEEEKRKSSMTQEVEKKEKLEQQVAELKKLLLREREEKDKLKEELENTKKALAISSAAVVAAAVSSPSAASQQSASLSPDFHSSSPSSTPQRKPQNPPLNRTHRLSSYDKLRTSQSSSPASSDNSSSSSSSASSNAQNTKPTASKRDNTPTLSIARERTATDSPQVGRSDGRSRTSSVGEQNRVKLVVGARRPTATNDSPTPLKIEEPSASPLPAKAGDAQLALSLNDFVPSSSSSSSSSTTIGPSASSPQMSPLASPTAIARESSVVARLKRPKTLSIVLASSPVNIKAPPPKPPMEAPSKGPLKVIGGSSTPVVVTNPPAATAGGEDDMDAKAAVARKPVITKESIFIPENPEKLVADDRRFREEEFARKEELERKRIEQLESQLTREEESQGTPEDHRKKKIEEIRKKYEEERKEREAKAKKEQEDRERKFYEELEKRKKKRELYEKQEQERKLEEEKRMREHEEKKKKMREEREKRLAEERDKRKKEEEEREKVSRMETSFQQRLRWFKEQAESEKSGTAGPGRAGRIDRSTSHENLVDLHSIKSKEKVRKILKKSPSYNPNETCLFLSRASFLRDTNLELEPLRSQRTPASVSSPDRSPTPSSSSSSSSSSSVSQQSSTGEGGPSNSNSSAPGSPGPMSLSSGSGGDQLSLSAAASSLGDVEKSASGPLPGKKSAAARATARATRKEWVKSVIVISSNSDIDDLDK